SFNDPNLWFKKHNNEEDWLKSVIIKETSNYRKNIDIISSEAKRTNQAFDFWILAAMTLLLSVLMAQALASLKLYVLNSCTFIAGMIIVLVCGIIIIYWELTREPKYQGRIKTTE
ncbi:MAG: hypothetical protein KAT70_00400, partial [Thermoplasmata archaeon]|nr:hypothetical protein [Thermoplasmata archaeon]